MAGVRKQYSLIHAFSQQNYCEKNAKGSEVVYNFRVYNVIAIND